MPAPDLSRCDGTHHHFDVDLTIRANFVLSPWNLIRGGERIRTGFVRKMPENDVTPDSSLNWNTFRMLLIFLCCSVAAIPQETGRRLAGQPVVPVRPSVQTSGCPDGKTVDAVRTPTGPVTSDDYVEVQRGRCFGSCAVYSVRVQADGQISWRGDEYVHVIGPAADQIAPEPVQVLLDNFRSAGFWSLCQSYTRAVSDVPTTITVVHLANTQKSVSDRADGAPDWLRELDLAVDTLADTHRWIHGDPRQETLPSLLSDGRGPKPGLTALMHAAWKGDLNEVTKQLSAKADPNAQDSSGATAVIYATQIANPEVLTALLHAGADPNLHTYAGQTAIMAASTAYLLPKDKIRILVAAGADLNVQDQNGETALMLAVRYHFEQPDVVALLVNSGARRDITDAAGLSALDRVEKDVRRSKLPAQYDTLRQLVRY
ncbi:MAG TPA: ankyrin repeat domain-containing protein [Bryobacteraceae bacterium]|nr:ankyrin repeat domain-containing protein [Bryobacteraceae bacterium]